MLVISIIGMWVCVGIMLYSDNNRPLTGDLYVVSATLGAIFLCMFLLGASQ